MTSLKDVIEYKVRHVRTPAGVSTYHEPIGSPIVPHPDVPAPKKGKKAPNNPNIIYNDAYNTQEMAQQQVTDDFIAKYRHRPMSLIDSPSGQYVLHRMSTVDPLRAWVFYQVDGAFQEIQNNLRHPEKKHSDRFYGQAMAEQMPQAFEQHGMDTEEPIKLYRGLKGGNNSAWADKLTVGTVFKDNGVTSTSGDQNEVIGFLADYGNAKTPTGSVILELHVPTGQRVLGGMEGTSEVMLPPGVSYTVTKVEQRTLRAQTADGRWIVHNNITYITVEVLP